MKFWQKRNGKDGLSEKHYTGLNRMKPLVYYKYLLDGRIFFNLAYDISKSYHYISVKDKVVLDVGADFGFSPLYFIKEGAKSVVAFSLDRQMSGLRHKDIKFHREAWDGADYFANIGKFDCEGREYIKPLKWYFDSFESCYLAIHDIPLYHDQFMVYKEELDVKAKLIYVTGEERMYVIGKEVVNED